MLGRLDVLRIVSNKPGPRQTVLVQDVPVCWRGVKIHQKIWPPGDVITYFRKCWSDFSSPEPLAQGELLWSLDGSRPSCVVRRQQLLQKTSPPKQLAGFWPNLVGMILIWPSFKIVQIILVHCIYRSHGLKSILKISFSETQRPKALIFGM